MDRRQPFPTSIGRAAARQRGQLPEKSDRRRRGGDAAPQADNAVVPTRRHQRSAVEVEGGHRKDSPARPVATSARRLRRRRRRVPIGLRSEATRRAGAPLQLVACVAEPETHTKGACGRGREQRGTDKQGCKARAARKSSRQRRVCRSLLDSYVCFQFLAYVVAGMKICMSHNKDQNSSKQESKLSKPKKIDFCSIEVQRVQTFCKFIFPQFTSCTIDETQNDPATSNNSDTSLEVHVRKVQSQNQTRTSPTAPYKATCKEPLKRAA